MNICIFTQKRYNTGAMLLKQEIVNICYLPIEIGIRRYTPF